MRMDDFSSREVMRCLNLPLALMYNKLTSNGTRKPVRSSYLYNGNFYTDKTASLYLYIETALDVRGKPKYVDFKVVAPNSFSTIASISAQHRWLY